MTTFRTLKIHSAMIIVTMIAICLSTAAAGNKDLKKGGGAPQKDDRICVPPSLDTCLGHKASCQAYGLFEPGGNCPGKHPSYRRRKLTESDESSDESSYGSSGHDPYVYDSSLYSPSGYGPYPGNGPSGHSMSGAYVPSRHVPSGHGYGYRMRYAPLSALQKFLCPCLETLRKYFDQVAGRNRCKIPTPHGVYEGYVGSYGRDNDGHQSSADFLCNECPSAKCSPSDGFGRTLDGGNDKESSVYGVGAQKHVGYWIRPTLPPPTAKCQCEQIEDVAIENFCIDFVGKHNPYGSGVGYGGGSYRKLQGDENYYEPNPCSFCIHDCVMYIKSCCSISVCDSGY